MHVRTTRPSGKCVLGGRCAPNRLCMVCTKSGVHKTQLGPVDTCVRARCLIKRGGDVRSSARRSGHKLCVCHVRLCARTRASAFAHARTHIHWPRRPQLLAATARSVFPFWRRQLANRLNGRHQTDTYLFTGRGRHYALDKYISPHAIPHVILPQSTRVGASC
jgi:hypothetical protein